MRAFLETLTAPLLKGRLLLALLAMAALVGSLCAAFLWSLDAVTRLRFDHPWLLFLLPVGGAGIGWLYHRYGQSVEAGNNLILDEIHEPGGGVPCAWRRWCFWARWSPICWADRRGVKAPPSNWAAASPAPSPAWPSWMKAMFRSCSRRG
jgi:hypothetical protein